MLRKRMRTEVNGTIQQVQIDPFDSSLELLRDRLGLTGTKFVCGTGACGACTVLVDGVAVLSCLLPAHALEGHKVLTIEALQHDLHPVQQAFIDNDALQCGFCTPGFVLAAVAYYEIWRKQHGTRRPTSEEVASALTGHLCRCGAYPGIRAAVQAACAGEYDDPSPNLGAIRYEAIEKVTGRAKFTVDVHLEAQLEGVILRSRYANARVGRIQSTAAIRRPGVHGIVNLLPNDRRVRYVGQAILAVAADSRHAAEDALQAVEVEYQCLPAVIGLDAARKRGASLVYEGRRKHVPRAEEILPMLGRWHGNVYGPSRLLAKHGRKARRLIAAARRRSDCMLLEETWRASAQVHSTFEPHACVADWRDDGLIVHLSTQAVSHVAELIARRWRLPPSRVRVLAEHVGGGFGSKLGLTDEAVAAVELSHLLKTPVRVVLDRREEMSIGGRRPATELKLGTLTDSNGQLLAISAESFSDTGAAIGSGSAGLLRFVYPRAAKYLADYSVATNVPPAKPFRGPSGPVAYWAIEQTVDEIAYRRHEDPVTLRRHWDAHPLRRGLYDWAEQIAPWRERGPVAATKARLRRGVGLAVATWFYYLQPRTRVRVVASHQGLSASVAVQDVGTGSRSVIARTVAEVFGIDPKEVKVLLGDSHLPPGPVSAGSSTTASVVPAAKHAAIQVRTRLLEATRVQLRAAHVKAEMGGVSHPGGYIPWRDVFAIVPETAAVGVRSKDAGGYYLPALLTGDFAYGRGLTAALNISEVEVDTLYGTVRVLRAWEGIAAGRIVARDLARSQCHGGIVQGIGYAIHEEVQVDPASGLLLSASFDHYVMTGMGETPLIDVHFIEEGFDHAVSGSAGLAELATLAVAASIGNAVFHATGWRPRELPISPDRLLAGVSR